MTALAVMVALVGAMFVVPSVRGSHGKPHVGDVNSNTGVCLLTDEDHVYGLYFDDDSPADGVTNVDPRVQVYAADSKFDDETTEDEVENAGDQPGFIDLETDQCEAAPDGADAGDDPDAPANLGLTFKITPDGTESPIVEPQPQSLLLALGDTDGIVKAGGANLGGTIYARNLIQGRSAWVQWIRVSGEVDHAQTDHSADMIPSTGEETSIVIPEGTTPGEYTVSVLAYVPDGNADSGINTISAGDVSFATGKTAPDSNEILRTSAKFTVGDPGVNAAEVQLSLATSRSDDPKTTANEQIDETGTTSADGSVWLKVAAMNSLGSKSNHAGLNSLTIIAPGGDIEIHAPGSGDAIVRTGTAIDPGPDSATATTLQDVMYVNVSKKGSPPKPGTVNVYALLIGSDGAPRSETLPLHFTGSASTLELGDVANTGAGEQTEFTISAKDAGGSNATVNRVSFRVTKKDDGTSVGQSVVKVEQSTQGKYTTDTDADDNTRQVTGLITTGSKAPAGVYEIAVSIVGVADSSTTAELVVTGKATDVAVMTDKDEVEIGKIVTVTAEVTDKQGALVADGTKVNFVAAGAFDLTAIDDDDVEEGGANVTTKDGMAEVRFVAVKGSGTSTIIVTAVNPDGSKASNTKSVMSVGTEEDAMPEEEAGLSCLSSLSGFSTWTCDVEASASEIFDWISSRGATALHLNSNRMWVRYSVVDGAMVPGSSDFMVTKSDILYISN